MSVLAIPFYIAGKGLSQVLGNEPGQATALRVRLMNPFLGFAVNAPNFWWYYMRLFGYPWALRFLPAAFGFLRPRLADTES